MGLEAGASIGLTRLALQATHELMGVNYGVLQTFIDLNSLYFSFCLFVLSGTVIFLAW